MFWQYANYTTEGFHKPSLDTFQCKEWIHNNTSFLSFTNSDTDTDTYVNAYRDTQKGKYQKYVNRRIKVNGQLEIKMQIKINMISMKNAYVNC